VSVGTIVRISAFKALHLKLTSVKSLSPVAAKRCTGQPHSTLVDEGGNVTRPRAADDFATIRARMEELRRERECRQATESDLQRDPPAHRARSLRWPPSEIGAAPTRVRQSGSGGG
jgi:hypothetical protein